MLLVAVAVMAILASGIASIAGFGIGSLLTPVFAAEYGMKTAVGAVAVPHFIATGLRLWRLRAHVDRRVLIGFGAMNAAGSLAGALVHVRVSSPILSEILGILLVFAGATGILGYAEQMRFGKATSWIAGAVSGAFGGLVGNQGGIRSAAMLGLGVKGPAFVATATAIGIAVDVVRMPVYLATESHEMLRAGPAIAIAIVAVIVGTLLGERVLRRIPEKIFRRVVAGILLSIGVYLLTVSPR